jgi:hypothetical protein
MPDLFPITYADMAAECERESRLRRRVYPRLIQSGKLTEDAAERQIRLMEAAAEALYAIGRAAR